MSDVILVSQDNQPVGVAEKLQAHKDGSLHRAFSIFIFNHSGQLMLQKRALSKYHSGGLWSNTVCSHQNPGESTMDAAHRRLQEEMGFDCPLREIFTFYYKAKLDKGMTEHEIDHVLIGHYESEPQINALEAEDWRWLGHKELITDIRINPQNYTYWLRTIIERVIDQAQSPPTTRLEK